MLLRSKLFYCLRLPIQAKGGDRNDTPGVIVVPGFNAASQQTLFIISGSPSNPILGEVNQMLFFWEIFLRLDESHSFWKLDKGPEHPIQALNRLKAL